jgi:hypothetical protein
MNCNISDIVLYAIGFIIFLFVQSLALNGWVESFKGSCVQELNKGRVCSGNIFYKIAPEFFEKHKGKTWTMPLWGCVKCVSSVIGGITFWGTVVPLFGFHWFEIWLWILDAFSLITLNYWIYKKL